MELKVGNKYGCLVVIGEWQDSEQEVYNIIKVSAEQTWEKYAGSGKEFFESYYNLDEHEALLYKSDKKMPDSFISKFKQVPEFDFLKKSGFLWHGKNPNTYNDFIKAYKKGTLYKVKCSICNRVFYMDSTSISCVKWRSCIGPECLANTIDTSGVDYTKSLYDWKQDKKELQILDYQVAKVDNLNNPLTYYSLDKSLKVAYVSDIHLIHHRKYYKYNDAAMIKDIVKKLYQSQELAEIILFGGDIASSKDLTVKFYTYFMRMYDYINLKKFKEQLMKYKCEYMKNGDEAVFVKRCEKIEQYINKLNVELSQEFDFSRFETYKHTYRKMESYENAFEYYKTLKSYKKLMLTEQTEIKILKIVKMLDIRNKYISANDKRKNYKQIIKYRVQEFEKIYGKDIENINLTDYRHKVKENVFAVLGNHEYMDFSNVQSAITYYEEKLSQIGINLLHNNYQIKDRYLIYGGTGFAKYNLKWNADSLVCCKNFSREDEIKETTLFEENYKNALEFAKKEQLCFICVSHYPVSACLNNKYDKEAIYFTGHNHKNEYVKTVDKVLYADNQIGYKDNNITFKIAFTGCYLNPYYDLLDGLYQTTIDDYLNFYRYIGESIGKGNILYQRCQDGKANLYVLKRRGYYGFFIVAFRGNARGISIVNGGKTKKLTKSIDLDWICENFDLVLSKYLQALIPLRNIQEQLSKELKELGLSGNIHGCIVDIDYYHHIMLNPYNNRVIYYYSSEFGKMMELNSFNEVIKSIECHSAYDCREIKRLFERKAGQAECLLAQIWSNHLLIDEDREKDDILYYREKDISINSGIYRLSRKINPLQRLFTGHVLRDFDLRLTETKQDAYRTYSYLGREFMYEGGHYKIIEDDGSEIIVAREMEDNDGSLIGEEHRFAITSLKSKFANENEFNTYWITDALDMNDKW